MKRNRFKKLIVLSTKHTIGIAKRVIDMTEKQLLESLDAHKGMWKSKWD